MQHRRRAVPVAASRTGAGVEQCTYGRGAARAHGAVQRRHLALVDGIRIGTRRDKAGDGRRLRARIDWRMFLVGEPVPTSPEHALAVAKRSIAEGGRPLLIRWPAAGLDTWRFGFAATAADRSAVAPGFLRVAASAVAVPSRNTAVIAAKSAKRCMIGPLHSKRRPVKDGVRPDERQPPLRDAFVGDNERAPELPSGARHHAAPPAPRKSGQKCPAKNRQVLPKIVPLCRPAR